MKLLHILIIASLLLAASFALFPNLQSVSAAGDCYSASGTGREGMDPEVGPMALSAGTTLTATASRPSGPIFMLISADTDMLYVNTIASPHTVTLEITKDANVTVFFGLYGDGDATFSVSTGDCGSATAYYPEDTVQGAFVSDSPLYWAPGQRLNPELTIEEGKHVYAGGLDESGIYRQVLIVCNWLWVPVETIGPNYDNPWYGTPLVDDFEIQEMNACVVEGGATAPVTWRMFAS